MRMSGVDGFWGKRRMHETLRRQRMQHIRKLSGIMTVELAYLMPILLLAFQVIIYSTFYFHDKNILLAAASETAVVAARYERRNGREDGMNPEVFFGEQIKGKLILFSGAQIDFTQTGSEIEITVLAKKGWMRLEVTQRAVISKPETKIRRVRVIKELIPGEEAGEGHNEESVTEGNLTE